MKHRIRPLAAAVLGLVGLCSLAGCQRGEDMIDSSRSSGPVTASGQPLPSTEKQIADIQNNPNMPPQAKEAAAAQIRAQSEAARSRTK